jgi:hypothetical protein
MAVICENHVWGFDNWEIRRGSNSTILRFSYANTPTFKKVAGYIPIIGIVVGLLRLHEGMTTPKPLTQRKIALLTRGSIELIGLGFLLILPDLITTILRARNDQSNAGIAAYKKTVADMSCARNA